MEVIFELMFHCVQCKTPGYIHTMISKRITHRVVCGVLLCSGYINELYAIVGSLAAINYGCMDTHGVSKRQVLYINDF